MAARLLLRERRIIAEDRFAEIVIWRLPRPAEGSAHRFKYRMALGSIRFACFALTTKPARAITSISVETEVPYNFTKLEQLVADFWDEVAQWRR